jgi:hypothetical protein
MVTLGQVLYKLRPNGDWKIVGDEIYANLEWFGGGTKPTQAECDSEQIVLEQEELLAQCKAKASALLYETDWTTIPDVADPANTPYLTNQAEFIAWRSQVRALAINPVVDPVFPTKPNEIWG